MSSLATRSVTTTPAAELHLFYVLPDYIVIPNKIPYIWTLLIKYPDIHSKTCHHIANVNISKDHTHQRSSVWMHLEQYNKSESSEVSNGHMSLFHTGGEQMKAFLQRLSSGSTSAKPSITRAARGHPACRQHINFRLQTLFICMALLIQRAAESAS